MKKWIVLFVLVGVALVLTGSRARDVYGFSRRKPRATDSSAITMLFAGDIMAHDVNYTRKPYSNIYAGIRSLVWEADLSFANLEFVFDPDEPASGYPFFNAPVRYAQAAVDSGFNVFSLANNHSFDLKGNSLIKTLSEIGEISSEHRIYYNGINTSPDAHLAPVFFELHDVKIGFLAVTSFLNGLIFNRLVNLVPYYDEEAEDELIERIREESGRADLFIVSYHGGIEYRRVPVERKRELFMRMIEAGADIVWGHHPHVTQPWETVHTRRGNKLILYSTGNLISGQTWNVTPETGSGRRDGTGESALFTVDALIESGNSVIRRVSAVPIFNYRHSSHGMVVKRFDEIREVEMGSEWELYYIDRLEKLEIHLYDSSSWGFER